MLVDKSKVLHRRSFTEDRDTKGEVAVTSYIAFSLYGHDDKYIVGALANARQASKYYPGWKVVFFCGQDVDLEVRNQLQSYGADTVTVTGPTGFASSAWRFQASFIRDAEAVIFRDTDSRLSFREANAVADWLRSEKAIHVMRDHPNHKWEIQGGMFGVIPKRLPRFLSRLANEKFGDYYGQDQDFLRRALYYPNRLSCFINDDFALRGIGVRRFSTPRKSNEFIGEIIDARGEPDKIARSQISKMHDSVSYRWAVRASTLAFRIGAITADFLRRRT